MIKDTIYGIIILALILVIIGGLIYFPKIDVREIYRRDTVITREPILIEAPAKIKYKTRIIRDTLFKDTAIFIQSVDSSSWVACIDTTIKKVSIGVCYLYPESKFNINLYSLPDTIEKVIYIEKPLIKYEKEASKWYEDVYKIGGGVLIGVVLTVLLR